MRNRYPGQCRRCWRQVPAGEVVAVRDGNAWKVEHASATDSGGCPPTPTTRRRPLIEISRGEGYDGARLRPGTVARLEWPPSVNEHDLTFPGVPLPRLQ